MEDKGKRVLEEEEPIEPWKIEENHENQMGLLPFHCNFVEANMGNGLGHVDPCDHDQLHNESNITPSIPLKADGFFQGQTTDPWKVDEYMGMNTHLFPFYMEEDKGKDVMQTQPQEPWKHEGGFYPSDQTSLVQSSNPMSYPVLETMDATQPTSDTFINGYFPLPLFDQNSVSDLYTNETNTCSLIPGYMSSNDTTNPYIQLGDLSSVTSSSIFASSSSSSCCSRSIEPSLNIVTNGNPTNKFVFSFMPTPTTPSIPDLPSYYQLDNQFPIAGDPLRFDPFLNMNKSTISNNSNSIANPSYDYHYSDLSRIVDAAIGVTATTSVASTTIVATTTNTTPIPVPNPIPLYNPMASSNLNINPMSSSQMNNNIPYWSSLSYRNHPYRFDSFPYRWNPLNSNYIYAYENRLDLSQSRPSAYMQELSMQIRELDKRVYRCTTCLMNFPNAQAFGGHMSSHSKSKKTKDITTEPSGPLMKKPKLLKIGGPSKPPVLLPPKHFKATHEVKKWSNVIDAILVTSSSDEEKETREKAKLKIVNKEEDPIAELFKDDDDNDHNKDDGEEEEEEEEEENTDEKNKGYMSDESVTSEFRTPKGITKKKEGQA